MSPVPVGADDLFERANFNKSVPGVRGWGEKRSYHNVLQNAESGEQSPEAAGDDQHHAGTSAQLEKLGGHNKSSAKICNEKTGGGGELTVQWGIVRRELWDVPSSRVRDSDGVDNGQQNMPGKAEEEEEVVDPAVIPRGGYKVTSDR